MISPLDNPTTAAHAWARFKRIMRWMALAAVLAILIAWALLYAKNGLITVHLYIAAALGIFFTVMLGGALMGLVFLSNGTGHDASVANQLKDSDER